MTYQRAARAATEDGTMATTKATEKAECYGCGAKTAHPKRLRTDVGTTVQFCGECYRYEIERWGR